MKQLFLLLLTIPAFASEPFKNDACGTDLSSTPVYFSNACLCAKCHITIDEEEDAYIFECSSDDEIVYLCESCLEKITLQYEQLKREFFNNK